MRVRFPGGSLIERALTLATAYDNARTVFFAPRHEWRGPRQRSPFGEHGMRYRRPAVPTKSSTVSGQALSAGRLPNKGRREGGAAK